MPPSEQAPPLDVVPEVTTLSEAVRRAADMLRAAGLDEPLSEARWLVAAAAGLQAVDLLVRGACALDAETAARVADFSRRRAAREPLSRIIGHRAFYGRDFALSPGTLDPRPDTEVLIDLALELLDAQGGRQRPLLILDVGTGSGAILVTLLAELPHAAGIGIDISDDALVTAAGNAAQHGISERTYFLRHDVTHGVLPPDEFAAGRQFDLIVSNPPYIPTEDVTRLEPEVRLHDPHAALDGGLDGLDFYRVLASALPLLGGGGWLVVEVGAGQAEEVARLLLDTAPGATLRHALDLAGHTRAVAVQPRRLPGCE